MNKQIKTLKINFLNVTNSEIMDICDRFELKFKKSEIIKNQEAPDIYVEGSVEKIEKFKTVYFKNDEFDDLPINLTFDGSYKLMIAHNYLQKLNKLFNKKIIFEITGEESTISINAYRIQILNVNDELEPFFQHLNYNNLYFIFVDNSNNSSLNYCELLNEQLLIEYDFKNLLEDKVFKIINLNV